MGSQKKLVLWLLFSVTGQSPYCFSVRESGAVWIYPDAKITKP
jgi:hypothetical protein